MNVRAALDGLLAALRDVHLHMKVSRCLVALDVRQVLLGHRERHVDGRDLVDGHERHVVGLHDVALLDGDGAGLAVDGRHDGGVLQLEPGVLHGGLVCLHDGVERVGVGPRLVVLLDGNIAFPCQGRITLCVLLGVHGLGAVADQGGLRLPERRLEGPRVDPEEHFPLSHILPFAEKHLGDLAVHLGLDRYRVVRFHVPDGLDLERNVLPVRSLRDYRHDPRRRLLGLGTGGERQHNAQNEQHQAIDRLPASPRHPAFPCLLYLHIPHSAICIPHIDYHSPIAFKSAASAIL